MVDDEHVKSGSEGLALRNLIEEAKNIVFFTGAGISTESGIPDFRSPGGIWTKARPIEFQDFVASEEMRKETWRRKMLLDREISVASPNRGHRAIAQLIKTGKSRCVITQNIDGLHQASGIDDDHIIELHGNGTYAKCLDCHRRVELALVFVAFEADETLPLCESCGGLVKPATISFGQSMPEQEMQRADEAARACDLFIVVGSSLVVFPAAGIPLIARQHGADLVIINREPTELDGYADLLLHQEIGPTLGGACAV